jgi:hypothetical protein
MQLASVNNLAISEDRALLNLGDRVFVPLEGTIELTPLEAAQSRSVRLVLDRGPMQTKTGTAVLVLRDDIGSLIRIPVTGKLP